MANRYHSRRLIKKYSQKSKRKLFLTLIITGFLLYSTLIWILPNFINIIGVIKNTLKPPKQTVSRLVKEGTFAPPILNIPYEATNTASVNISGFGTVNSKVRLYLDDEAKQTVDVSSDRTFTFENVPLNWGTNNIYGTTLDSNRESLPSKTIKLIYDNQNPALSVNEPEDNKIIQGGDKKVQTTGRTDPGAKVFINNTQIIVGKNGDFSSEQSLNEGENTITIKAVSPASNTTEIQRRVIYEP